MRVAIDAAALGSGRGGDETYLLGLLSGVAEVAGSDDRFPLYLRRDAEPPAAVTGSARFEIRRVPAGGGGRRLVASLPWRLLRDAERPDLLFAHTHAPVWAPAPIALLVTDLSFHHHPEHYPLHARLRLNQLVPRQARRASAVITISEFCRRDLISTFDLVPERVHVVGCAVQPPPALSREAEERAAGWLERSGVRRPFVLYLGNLHPRKNVPRLIEAYVRARRSSAAVAGHQLVIAGARWWGGSLEDAAAAAAPEGAVRLLGRVDDEQREVLLRTATLLAYPSLFEGFGLPPLEAMARGTPVLTSDVASIPEATGDAAFLVDPFDVGAIADGLVRVLEDSELRARLCARGRRRPELFSARRAGEQAMAAFRKAVEGAGHAGSRAS